MCARCVLASPVCAADKAHQQLMAEIRMLQEQQQQLQQMLGGLTDTLKTVTAKLDDQTGREPQGVRRSEAAHRQRRRRRARASREGGRHQRAALDGVAGARGGAAGDRVDAGAVRRATARRHRRRVPRPIRPPAGTAVLPARRRLPAPRVSSRLRRCSTTPTATTWRGSTSSRSSGFNTYIASFPKSDKADDAQLNIGNALYGAGKFREAVDAYQKVITNYPTVGQRGGGVLQDWG